jgi:undecaprenyl-diphosphatase
MRANYVAWTALSIIVALVSLAMKFYAYFPGDVAVEKAIQSLVPSNLSWAEGISKTAESPWIFIILALIFALSWFLAGWRAALLAILSFMGMLALGKWLGPVIGRPRPSPELVRVFRPLSGYSFPSLFALRYAATLGFLAVLAAVKNSGLFRSVIVTACGVLFILGFIARIALGAHWPSDVIVSFLIGLLWASLLVRFA